MLEEKEVVSGQAHKRQRILIANQSKYGCYTCKLRRVKCDETKPVCLRCIRSDRQCDGYPTNAPGITQSTPTNSRHEQKSLATFNLDFNDVSLTPISKQISIGTPLITLGCHVFIADRSSRYDGPGTTFTSNILPSLCYTFPLVASACTLFGASYEARVLRKSLNTSGIASAYAQILRDVKQSIQTRQEGTLALVVACSLIAASDTILRRHGHALLHLEGALALFQHDGPGRHIPPEVQAFLHSLDLLASTLALARPLTLPMLRLQDIDLDFSNIQHAEICVMNLLQVCYNFTATAGRFKYTPPATIPSQVELDQGNIISKLIVCLRSLENLAPVQNKDDTAVFSKKAHGHASLLKAQCLSTLIYASTILDPYESAYDKYSTLFQQTADNVEIALHTIHAAIQASVHRLPRFSPSPGLNSALCLTAHKCRDPTIRRKAITLMFQAGIEGPWDGSVEARIASRMVEIEEHGLGRIQDSEDGSDEPVRPIPEKARISGVNIVHEATECNASSLRVAVVRFSQCVDVETMMTGDVPFYDNCHWRYWTEQILVP